MVTACFGEILLRLTPPGFQQALQSPMFSAHVGGAEANVAVALSSLGFPARVISVLPDEALGRGCIRALRQHGVDTACILRTNGRLGLYYLEQGAGARASEVTYDRKASAFAELPAEAWDWPLLLDGCDRLHLSGITPALGAQSARATLDLVAVARAKGLSISFDGNYRERLWSAWDGDARTILSQIVAQTDLLFGNHKDISLLLGQTFDGDGSTRRRVAALAAFDAFPNLRTIASTARYIVNTHEHRLTARADTRDAEFETPPCIVSNIVDRIGTGDAFAAGVLAGLAQPVGLQEAIDWGIRLAALKHSLPGDVAPFSREELLSSGAGVDVRR